MVFYRNRARLQPIPCAILPKSTYRPIARTSGWQPLRLPSDLLHISIYIDRAIADELKEGLTQSVDPNDANITSRSVAAQRKPILFNKSVRHETCVVLVMADRRASDARLGLNSDQSTQSTYLKEM